MPAKNISEVDYPKMIRELSEQINSRVAGGEDFKECCAKLLQDYKKEQAARYEDVPFHLKTPLLIEKLKGISNFTAAQNVMGLRFTPGKPAYAWGVASKEYARAKKIIRALNQED